MSATLSERYARQLFGSTKHWGDKPPISWWFILAPGLLIAGAIFFAMMGATEFAWLTVLLLFMVSWMGFHMWMCHGIMRLLAAKDAEIEMLKRRCENTQATQGPSSK